MTLLFIRMIGLSDCADEILDFSSVVAVRLDPSSSSFVGMFLPLDILSVALVCCLVSFGLVEGFFRVGGGEGVLDIRELEVLRSAAA